MPMAAAAGLPAPARMFADGRFFTPDGKARFVDVERPPTRIPRRRFPLTLNTGRVRDHWHTMTRTGKSQRLSQHCAEPFVEIHPQDAARHHIGDADLVRVSTGLGAVLVRALLTPRQQPGSIFVPMHWNDQFASRARIDALVAGDHRPDLRPAGLEDHPRARRALRRRGLRVCGAAPQAGDIRAEYWAIAKCSGGWRVELAFAGDADDWTGFVTHAGRRRHGADVVAYHDAKRGRHRFACYDGDALAGAVFLAPEPVAVSRDWAIAQLAAPSPARGARTSAIAGRPAKAALDRGATVCSCFGVGANEIAAAVARGCTTVAAIGEALQAGTNCGSCRAEIRNIIDAHRSTPGGACARRR